MDAFPHYQANLDRRAVSRVMRAWQAEAGMTATALAKAAGWSAAKMSLMLNSIGPVSEADVLTVAMILGADPGERELALCSVVRSRNPGTWDGRPCLGWGLAELETEASELRIVAGELLPLLLQTQAYAGAVLAAQAVVLSEHRLPYDRALREATVARLFDPSPLRLEVVLSEAALRRTIGGPKVMSDQLVWLLRLMELENVTVQVVPCSGGAFPGLGSSFACLSFMERHLPDVVAAELLHSVMWLEQEEERVPYEHTFLKLQEGALSVAESVEFVADVLNSAS